MTAQTTTAAARTAETADTDATADAVERVEAFGTMTRKLGHWTGSRRIEVRARRGHVVIDLRSPHIPEGDVEIRVDTDRSVVKLLVHDDTAVDQWDLAWVGRGRVKDAAGGAGEKTGRRVRLTGTVRNGEIRVARGGVATLAAVFTREFLADAKQAHRTGTRPTVHDPSDTHE